MFVNENLHRGNGYKERMTPYAKLVIKNHD